MAYDIRLHFKQNALGKFLYSTSEFHSLPRSASEIPITAVRNILSELSEFRNLSLSIENGIRLTIELSECFLFQRLSWWFDPPHQDQWQRRGIWGRNEMRSVLWVKEVFSRLKQGPKNRLKQWPKNTIFFNTIILTDPLVILTNPGLHLAYTSVVFQPCTDRQTDRQTDR